MSNLRKQIEHDLPELDQLIQAQTELIRNGEINTLEYERVTNEMMMTTRRWLEAAGASVL